jgi:hypothetical protein
VTGWRRAFGAAAPDVSYGGQFGSVVADNGVSGTLQMVF